MICKKKRKRYSIIRSVHELIKEMEHLPNDDEVYKFILDGNFSSISFIVRVANETVINQLYASSLRIGKKQMQVIDSLHKSGRINQCHFAVGTIMENDSDVGKRYKYYDNFKGVCDKNGWKYATVNNHSKIILFDTDSGKYVLETSSNLNDNPKIEQFSFEKDDEMFDFYQSNFERWESDG